MGEKGASGGWGGGVGWGGVGGGWEARFRQTVVVTASSQAIDVTANSKAMI